MELTSSNIQKVETALRISWLKMNGGYKVEYPYLTSDGFVWDTNEAGWIQSFSKFLIAETDTWELEVALGFVESSSTTIREDYIFRENRGDYDAAFKLFLNCRFGNEQIFGGKEDIKKDKYGYGVLVWDVERKENVFTNDLSAVKLAHSFAVGDAQKSLDRQKFIKTFFGI